MPSNSHQSTVSLTFPAGHYIDLEAGDGSPVIAYVAQPSRPPEGVLVVLQHMDMRQPGAAHRQRPPGAPESPGVNPHVRQMAERLAADGFLAIAPSTFGRGTTGVDYGYRIESSRWSTRLARPLQALPSPAVMLDVEAAIQHGRRLAPTLPIGVVGYCWGGLLAWRAACRLPHVSAAVCHYPGGLEFEPDLSAQPACPVLVHVGNDSRSMTQEGIETFERIHATDANVTVDHHDAAYGFMQPDQKAFVEAVFHEAHDETLAFLRQHLTQRQPA